MSHILDPLNATMSLSDPDQTSAAAPLLMLAFFTAGNGLFTAPTGTGFIPRALAQKLPVTHHARVTSVEETRIRNGRETTNDQDQEHDGEDAVGVLEGGDGAGERGAARGRPRPVRSAAGAMTDAQRDELDTIDPGWCPAWDTRGQRCYRLVHNHVQAGGTLPTVDGDIVVQGEDLGRWVNAQRFGWEQLLLVQQ
ncbi:hypothetical protein ACWGRV_22005 [Streptomyces sp. NPDC055663]